MNRRHSIKNKQLRTNSRADSKTKSATLEKSILVLFNKPYNTLCQFTGEPGDTTLAQFIDIKKVYPAGRLDKDSEGLLVLTNDGKLQNKISSPKHKLEKCYWVQVEGQMTLDVLEKLSSGVVLKDGLTRSAKARLIAKEELDILWSRTPEVRFRQNIPTSWLELKIKEGKNRQVRRMTAAVGFPTLRLIRMSVGEWNVDSLLPGEYKTITP